MTRPFFFMSSAIMLGALLGIWFNQFLFTPTVLQPEGMVYYLKPGMSKNHFAKMLAQQQGITHRFAFLTFLWLHPLTPLKFGEYYFSYQATPYQIGYQVTTGTGFYYRAFTIIPGWSIRTLKQALLSTVYIKHTLSHTTDSVLANTLRAPSSSLEGLFFPDTYYYTRNTTDMALLQQAYKRMQQQLARAWLARDPTVPYQNAYEALIAASLIEKETHLLKERAIIAGILINRLHQDMPLQMDPTVIYGLGDRYQGLLHKSDLLIDNAYNTYLHKGLPPTPIAIPSLDSIQATLHPAQHNYYYFVATGKGDHHFSKTFNAHRRAIRAEF